MIAIVPAVNGMKYNLPTKAAGVLFAVQQFQKEQGIDSILTMIINAVHKLVAPATNVVVDCFVVHAILL